MTSAVRAVEIKAVTTIVLVVRVRIAGVSLLSARFDGSAMTAGLTHESSK